MFQNIFISFFDKMKMFISPSINEYGLLTNAYRRAQHTFSFFYDSLLQKKPSYHYFFCYVEFVDKSTQTKEFLWVKNVSTDYKYMYGTIEETPSFISSLKKGSKVGFEIKNIFDWKIETPKSIYGNYIHRACIHRRSWFKNLFYKNNIAKNLSGNDVYPLDRHTPEGTILLFQRAVVENKPELIIECKDFKFQANKLLKNTGGKNKNITSKTLEKDLKSIFLKKIKNDKHKIERSVFVKKIRLKEDLYRLTQICFLGNNTAIKKQFLMIKKNNEWKLVRNY